MMYQPPNSPNVQSTITFLVAVTAGLVTSLVHVGLPAWTMAIGWMALFMHGYATNIKLHNPNQMWVAFIVVVIATVVGGASVNALSLLTGLFFVAFLVAPRVVAWRGRAALKNLPSYYLGQLAWLVTHLDPSADHIVPRAIAGAIGYLSRWYYLNASAAPLLRKWSLGGLISRASSPARGVAIHSSLSVLLIPLILTVGATTACTFRAPMDNQPMRATTTYLHLLRRTPFFIGLTDDQLRWVIQHSHEWEVQAGTVIMSSDRPHDGDGVWVLLDGRWTLETPDWNHASGPADAGMWFTRDLVSTSAFKLLANDRSYVMQITSGDMHEMLRRGFRFETRLVKGRNLYRKLGMPREATPEP